MNTPEIRRVLASILIGACVAFVSALSEGLVHALQSYGTNIAGGVASAAVYLIKRA